MADLHDKILSCDDLATKTLPQLGKMRKFYEIKTKNMEEKDALFRYKQWLWRNPKINVSLFLGSIVILVVSFYLAIVFSKFFIISSVLAMLYLMIIVFSMSDVREQAIMKNITTINYMIQTFNEKEEERKKSVFRRKARIVYECIRDTSNNRINSSELLKAARKHDNKLDKNTIKKILDEDLIDVIEKEEGPYSTNSRDLSKTTVYKLKKL